MYMSYVLDFKEKQMEGTRMLLLPGKFPLDMYIPVRKCIFLYIQCPYQMFCEHICEIFVHGN